MHNFRRVLRLSLRYRWSWLGILTSSTLVAALWGTNLGTVYPIVEVVLQNRSLQQWIDETVESSATKVTELQGRLESLPTGSATATAVGETQRTRAVLATELEAEQRVLHNAQRLQPYVHRYLPDRPFPTLVAVVSFLVCGTLLKSVFLIVNVVLVERVTQLVTFDLRKLFYRRTLSMGLANFTDDRTSQLMSRFTHDMEGITAGVKTILGRAIREPLKIIVCMIGAGLVCWRLLLFCLIVTPVAMLLINHLSRSVKRANRRAMSEMALLYQQLSESLRGIQTVKAFTMERHERRRFHKLGKQYVHRAQRIAQYNVLTRTSTELMSIGVICLALLGGGYLVLNQETHLFGIRMSDRPLSFGALLAFFALLAGVSDPFRKLAEVYNQIQRGAAAADRVYELTDRTPDIPRGRAARGFTGPLREIRFDDVTFGYTTDPSGATLPVLRDFRLVLTAGQTLAIVGPNGCGKSTLIQLLPRFYEPQSGSVQWNGVDLREYHLPSLRQRIGLVSQHTMLFDDTVKNNIRYGSPQASDEQIIAAARLAHAHGFIEQKLADGYDTLIGEGGGRLSGGQRQRIALARAILRDPELLILDEATSQIDIESEQLIHEALRTLIRGRTSIMVTHRLATLALADKILVMQSGRAVDLGTHAELIQRCETYRNLHEMQFKASA